MCIVHKGFSGFRAVSPASILGGNLKGLKPAIPYDTIHSTLCPKNQDNPAGALFPSCTFKEVKTVSVQLQQEISELKGYCGERLKEKGCFSVILVVLISFAI